MAEIPQIGVWTMVLAAAAISGIGGTIRSCRRSKPLPVALVDGMAVSVLGLCGSMIAVIWLAGGNAPAGAAFAIIGCAGMAGLIGISAWDAVFAGVAAAIKDGLVRWIHRWFGGGDDE